MKTGIGSSAYFTLTDYEKGLREAARHGFDCVDFQCFNWETNPIYGLSDGERLSLLREIRDCAGYYGIEFYQSHAPWWHICTEDKLSFYEKAIRGVSELGIRYMAVHPVTDFSVPDDQPETMERVHQYNLHYFSRLLPLAKACDVTLCIENLPNVVLGLHRVSHIKRLVQELNDSHIRACLDTGHAHVYGDNMTDAILLLGEDLQLVHVHDNVVEWNDEHLLPYQGTICWADFYSGLRQVQFPGVLSLELRTPYTIPHPFYDRFHIYAADLARYMARQSEA